MINTSTSYQLIARDMAKSIERVASQAMVERESQYYLENIETIKSAKDFIANTRLFSYAMKAFGLEEMTYAKALMVKAMEQGIDEDDALANKLVDARYKEFVETFNFNRYGDKTTIFDRTRQGTVDKYVRQTLELQAGEQNEGVRLALYFERKASSATSVYGLLADPALAKVVRTALGIPDEVAAGDLDKQVVMIEKHLDIEDLKDPEGLSKFLARFTAMWEMSNPSTPAVTQLFSLIQPAEFGISYDTMLALSNLKR
jgi:hypothetical protein